MALSPRVRLVSTHFAALPSPSPAASTTIAFALRIGAARGTLECDKNSGGARRRRSRSLDSPSRRGSGGTHTVGC